MYWKRKLFCLATLVSMMLALNHVALAQRDGDADLDDITGTTPVAMVYVASNPRSSSNNEIIAFAAAKDGKLVPVPGSPFQADLISMAVNGKYLFGASRNGLSIDAWTIEPNGSLEYAAATDIPQPSAGDCANAGPIFLDHSGASLYSVDYRGTGCANNDYQSFNVVKSSGKLQNLGTRAVNNWLYLPASFLGNNVYAYTASCISNMYSGIYGFKRSSNGLLNEISITAPKPEAPAGDFYCPSQAAADPTNHVAIAMQPVNQQDFTADGGAQIASYTAASNGDLSTTNTDVTMPRAAVASVTDLSMAPSGKLLAISGTGGLQVFHFNGAGPLTPFTGLLTKDPIDQMFWDNYNHLYAISRAAGKLHVFTVTPAGAHEAPASPYPVSSPQSVIVQPWPRPWN